MKETVFHTKHQIPIYHYPNPALHSFCIGLYVRAGVLYETPDQNGISHFLEHLLFRNLNEAMGGTLYETLDRLGLYLNGCTYKELIQFKITGAPTHFKEAARLLLGLLQPLTLSAAAIDVERKRIKAEIRENDDLHSLDYYADQLIWAGTPLAMPIAGSPSTLNRLRKTELENARQNLFAPDRLHFYLTGSITEVQCADFCKMTEKALAGAASSDRSSQSLLSAPVSARFGKRGPDFFLKKARYCYVKIGFDLHIDRYDHAVLDYLYDLLFLGDSCQTYTRLSEETGYVYSFDPCLEKYGHTGCLSLSFGVSAQNLSPALETALRMFADMREALPDLSRVRPAYTDNLPMLLDQPEQLNWTGGYENHILHLKDASLKDRKRRYEAVTPEQVRKAARSIFQKENLCLAVKYSGKPVTEASLQELTERSGL